MRKAVFSAVCSGLVIPGIGQIINRDMKKGLFILAGVFVIFVAIIIKLFYIISAVLRDFEINRSSPRKILDILGAQDISLLWYLLVAFTVLWLYSVMDAYLTGKKTDQIGRQERL
jgi:archaellum biogenesis protein FlaJ (TadC family)